MIAPPAKSSVTNELYLSGVFAPALEEVTDAQLTVIGAFDLAAKRL